MVQSSDKFIEAIKINGGLNMDDHPSNVPAGDFTMAINVRTLSSNNTSTAGLVPSYSYNNFGTLGTVTPYFGTTDAIVMPTGNNAFNFFSGAAYPCNFYIEYCTQDIFYQSENVSYNILHVRKVLISGDNGTYLAIYRVKATDDNFVPELIVTLPIAYFESGVAYEPSKCIGIGDWLFVIVNGVVYKIPNTPNNELVIMQPVSVAYKYSLIKRPPTLAPIVDGFINNAMRYMNQVAPNLYPIVADQVQFCTTFSYFDGTETPIGVYSSSYPLLNVDNYLVQYPMNNNELAANFVEIVNFYYKINDDGLWKKIGSYKNSGNVEYPYINYNPTVRGGTALPTNRQAKYFEAIPYQSLRIENINSKVVLANNKITTESITKVGTPNGKYVIYNESIGMGTSSSLNYNALIYKGLKAGGRYRIGMFGIDEFNRPSYVCQISDITVPRSYTDDYGLVPANYVVNQGSVFLGANKILNATIPVGLISYALFDGNFDDYNFPPNILKVMFCATKCLNIDLFLEGIALFFYYYLPVSLPDNIESVGNYGRYILSDKYVEQTQNSGNNSISGCTGIAIVLNGGEAYNWKQGDRLYVKTFISSLVIKTWGGFDMPEYEILPLESNFLQDFEIIEQIGNVLILDPSSKNWGLKYHPIGAFELVSGAKQFSLGVSYEIYRPIGTSGEGQPYYAFSEPLDIDGLISGDIQPPPFQGDTYQIPYYFNGNPDVGQPMKDLVICGGSYLISLDTYPYDGIGGTSTDQLHTLRINFWKTNTSWNPRKPYDTDWNKRGDGWTNIEAPSILPVEGFASGHMIASNPLIQGGSLDGTGNFDSTDATILPYEMGGISEILRITDNQNELGGSILLAIGSQKTATVYVNRSVIQDVSGINQISLTNNVFNTINVLKEQLGCLFKDYKGVVRGNNNVYWFDGLHKKVVRYNLNGLLAISDVKMKNFFYGIGTTYTSVVGGFEYVTNSYYIGFGGNNDLKTIIWSEQYNRWAGTLNYLPYLFISQGSSNSFSFLDAGESGLLNNSNIVRYSPNGLVNYDTATIEFSINNKEYSLKMINNVYIAHNYLSVNQAINTESPFDVMLRIPFTQFSGTEYLNRIGLAIQNSSQRGGVSLEMGQRGMYVFQNGQNNATECLDSNPIDAEGGKINIFQFYAALLRIDWKSDFLSEGIITPIVNIKASGLITDTE